METIQTLFRNQNCVCQPDEKEGKALQESSSKDTNVRQLLLKWQLQTPDCPQWQHEYCNVSDNIERCLCEVVGRSINTPGRR